MLRFWRAIALCLMLALPLAARGDRPPQVIAAIPGSAGPMSGAIDRFTLRFSDAMVALGDPRAVAPATTDCPGAGDGHWIDAQTWVLDFAHALPPATRCKVTLRDTLATLAGTRVSGLRSFSIDTAGPSVRAVLAPGEDGSAIDEDQVFLVATNGPADPASIAAHAACAIDGVGEAAAVNLLPHETVTRVLDGLGAQDWHRRDFLEQAEIPAALPGDARAKAAALAHVVALQCRRPLPPDRAMALVWPAAITDPHGVPAGRDQRFDFTVRAAFDARFECSRANGRAGCSPITDAHVRFAAPIDRDAALAIRLTLADGSERQPRLSDEDRSAPQVTAVTFAGPFPADSDARLSLPAGLHDLSGRPLANATRFPLPVHFDPAPPLVKFAAPFGIIEAGEGDALPVTVRAVESSLAGHVTGIGGVSSRIADDDATIAQWLRKLDKANADDFETRQLPGDKTETINHTGEHAILPQGTPLTLGLPGKGKDFEVLGIPLGGKGFHVVELASPALGNALLGRNVPRYVAAGALVTDMAVHFKWGRESSLVWVTQLSTGKPVAQATVRISDSCNGHAIASGTSDASGRLLIHGTLPAPSLGESCEGDSDHPLFVSARLAGDMSFVLSSWTKGISPWDFSLPWGPADKTQIVHTVFDRTLVRVGETVHFRHILRNPVGSGFAFGQGFAGTLVFAHQGSDVRFTQTATLSGSGGEGEWTVPQGAPLGDYALSFEVGDKTIDTGQTIRVDEYKLPTMRASVTGPKEALVQPTTVPLSLFVGYLSGGGAGQLPVTVRSQFSTWFPAPKGWDAFTFGGEDVVEGTKPVGSADDEGGEDGNGGQAGLPYAQTLPATLGSDGSAHSDVTVNRPVTRPLSLTVEMDYPDANGQTMTASRYLRLFPAALQIGLRTDGWMMRADDVRLEAAVLDLDDRPVAGARVQFELYTRETITARRRLIGGFYAYDNQQKITRLGDACAGSTDATGRAHCRLSPGVSGEVLTVARVTDAQGHETRAVSSVWLAGKDDWWFGGDNGDRMDVIPEQTAYKAGETAKFQVRMPFREATALVTVEREGVLSSFVTTLSGSDPVVEVPLPGAYAPNVYVSVMAVRGRVSGWALWWADLVRRWHIPFFSTEPAAPATATVDLAKPSYRIGMAKVMVGWEAHKLTVDVSADRARYGVRDTAQVTVAVHRPDGQPAQGADVTLVAVDEALLQLMPNPTWDVLSAMMGERNLEVATSTAQMQVVGKRHYGRKAVAAGGGGGDASGVNRENFQPVLLWRGHLALDGAGRARVGVPLSDALSRFRIVAVATDGADLFGTGTTSVRTAQDLTIYPGLPDLVRTGDHYDAVFTLRNGSDHAMTVTAQPTISPSIAHAGPLTLTIPAGAAGRMRWGLYAPPAPGTLTWTLHAQSGDGKARDTVTVRQDVLPAVPEEVTMATLLRVGDPGPSLMIARPAGALAGGAVGIDLADTLAAPLDGVRRYMAAYPYDCFEQRLSKIIVAGDSAGWTALAAALPTYQDGDGLVRFWPDGDTPGSPELTAYVLSASSAAGLAIPDGPRSRMIAALQRVVTGQLTRDHPWQADERPLRVAALAALARAGAANPGLIARIDMVPADMPTGTLADWIVALDRVNGMANAALLRGAADYELRRRLVWAGTRLDLADQGRAPWWLLMQGDDMAIRALDAIMGKPGWADLAPRMMVGVAARQNRGHWDTTPANAWGVLVTRRFAAAYPAAAIVGTTHLALGGRSAEQTWPRPGPAAPISLPLVNGPLGLSHSGGPGPWANVSIRAAVPLTRALFAGYRLSRTVSVVTAHVPGRLTQGDVLRIHLEIDADAGRSQVALSDPLPPGAVVLSNLGGQSQILAQGEKADGGWPAWVGNGGLANGRGAWHAYYGWLPQGHSTIDYTVRLNSAGRFTLPPARVEAMYAPAIFAAVPVAPVTVWPR